MDNGTFVPTNREDVPTGTRIFGRKFPYKLKRGEAGLKRKSRLMAQGHNDEGATLTATKAPRVQRSSQRTLVALALSMLNSQMFGRDITQAYTQSTSILEIKVYISAPEEMGLPKITVLRVVKSL